MQGVLDPYERAARLDMRSFDDGSHVGDALTTEAEQ